VYSTRGESRVISSNELIPRWEKRGGGGMASAGPIFLMAGHEFQRALSITPCPLSSLTGIPLSRCLAMSRQAFLASRDGMPGVLLSASAARVYESPRRVYHPTAGTTFAFITILRNSRSLISFQPFPQIRLSSFLTYKEGIICACKITTRAMTNGDGKKRNL